MKSIELRTLRFSLEVPDQVHYHDDGVVDDLVEHYCELAWRYNDNLLDKWLGWRSPIVPRILNHALGVCCWFFPPKLRTAPNSTASDTLRLALEHKRPINVHTFVARNLPPYGTVAIRGHEETHALIDLGKLDVLQSALEAIGVSSSGLPELSDEAVCDIGGMYAVAVQNCGKEAVLNYAGGEDSPRAREILAWMRKHNPSRVRDSEIRLQVAEPGAAIPWDSVSYSVSSGFGTVITLTAS